MVAPEFRRTLPGVLQQHLEAVPIKANEYLAGKLPLAGFNRFLQEVAAAGVPKTSIRLAIPSEIIIKQPDLNVGELVDRGLPDQYWTNITRVVRAIEPHDILIINTIQKELPASEHDLLFCTLPQEVFIESVKSGYVAGGLVGQNGNQDRWWASRLRTVLQLPQSSVSVVQETAVDKGALPVLVAVERKNVLASVKEKQVPAGAEPHVMLYRTDPVPVSAIKAVFRVSKGNYGANGESLIQVEKLIP